MDYQNITYKIDNRIGYITMCRPEKRNALNANMIRELKDAFVRAEASDEVKVIILKAEGKVFSAGADVNYLKAVTDKSDGEVMEDSRNLMELYRIIYLNNKVVIALVEGNAIAGGCGLATVCDFCFAVEDAKFGYTEVRIGYIPAIVMIFLIRKIGEGRAKALLLSGRMINVEEAKGIGLINEILDARDIDEFSRKFALRMCQRNSSSALKSTKNLIAAVQDLTLDDALDLAARKSTEIRQTEDFKKGIAAFLDKKTIKW